MELRTNAIIPQVAKPITKQQAFKGVITVPSSEKSLATMLGLLEKHIPWFVEKETTSFLFKNPETENAVVNFLKNLKLPHHHSPEVNTILDFAKFNPQKFNSIV